MIFVKDTLGIGVDTTVGEYIQLIDRLSKYTHISEATFAVPDPLAEQQAVEALETFEDLFTLIEERRESSAGQRGESSQRCSRRRSLWRSEQRKNHYYMHEKTRY